MRKQAERWGAELRTEDVEFVDVTNRPFTVKSSDYEVRFDFYCDGALTLIEKHVFLFGWDKSLFCRRVLQASGGYILLGQLLCLFRLSAIA